MGTLAIKVGCSAKVTYQYVNHVLALSLSLSIVIILLGSVALLSTGLFPDSSSCHSLQEKEKEEKEKRK